MFLTINRVISRTRVFVSHNSRGIATLLFLAYIAGCITLMSTDPGVNDVAIILVLAVGAVGVMRSYRLSGARFAGTVTLVSMRERFRTERGRRFKRHLELKDRARELIAPMRLPFRREFRNGDVTIIIEDTRNDCEGWEATFQCSLQVTNSTDYWLTLQQYVTTFTFMMEPGKFRVNVKVMTELMNGLTRASSTDKIPVTLRQKYLLRKLKRNEGRFDEDRELRLLIMHLESIKSFTEETGS